jgi:hypothetical protein
LLREQKYLDFCQTAQGTKILDNGAAEGLQVTARDLINMATYVDATEIVVPDVLGDGAGTIQFAKDFERIAVRNRQFKYIGVVQGRDMAEAMKCLQELVWLDYIEILALPRSLCTIHRMQRHHMAEALAEVFKDRWAAVHCLGSSRWTREVVMLAECSNLRGIDTAMPFALAEQGIVLGVNDEQYEYRPHGMDYFNHDTNRIERGFIDQNIRTFDTWAKAPTS